MKNLLILFLCLQMSSLMAQQEYILHENIQYDNKVNVDPELLSLDVYIPNNGKDSMPVIMYVHGGGWSLGDKNKVAEKPAFFTKSGFVFISINYRLSHKTLGPPEKPDKIFPMHAKDIAHAFKWVFDNVKQYNGDEEKIILMGHSAGAHLANIIATNEKFLNDAGLTISNIAGVCSLDAGVYDVENEITNASGKARKNMLLNAFGYDTLVYQQASPISHIDKDKAYPPFLLVYQNDHRRKYWNELFGNRVTNTGAKVFHFQANEYSHIQIDNWIGSTKDTMELSQAILNFAKYCTE